jgi:hypothetical protein
MISNLSTTVIYLIVLNAFAFIFYGYNCLFSERMSAEFNRFNLSVSQRKITGGFQILGAVGILAGLFYYPLGFIASIGLCLLMLLGFAVRLKIKDSFTESSPSFFLMLLNGYFAWSFGLVLGLW